MDHTKSKTNSFLHCDNRNTSIAPPSFALTLIGLVMLSLSAGCASWSNPVANGTPVYLVPQEYLAFPKKHMKSIPPSALRRKKSGTYLLSAGDILGVYVEGAIGNERELPPVSFPESETLPPSLGFPIPIRSDGTIPLPLIDSVNVAGMTIEQAEEAVKYAYTQKRRILKEGRQRIIVTIIRPRTVRVLVVRKDQNQNQNYTPTSNFVFRDSVVSNPGDASDGHVIELPATEADVFTALARSGGLPDDSAQDEILIYRNQDVASAANANPVVSYGENPPMPPWEMMTGGDVAERIPFRIPEGSAVNITNEQVVLRDGDMIVIDAREPEFYYTAGLFPNREVPLPHSYDLTVTEAIARVGGPMANGGFGGNNLSGVTVAGGLGNPSPSLVSVLRTTSDGQQVNIRVDLNDALRDPREDILIMPDDMLILQETPRESFARYISGVFGVGIVGDFFQRGDAIGAATLTLP